MTKPLAIFVASGLAAGSAHAAFSVLYSDQFNNGGVNGEPFNDSTTPEVNLLGAAYELESYGLQQSNKVDRLHFQETAGIGGVRFGAADGRYNWATPTIGNYIVDGGGLHISFTMRTGKTGDFIAFGFGMDGADPTSGSGYGTVYADDGADWGIRFGSAETISFEGGTTTPIYRTTTSDGGVNDYSFGSYDTFSVDLYLAITSFNAGSTVTASVVLDDLDGTVITMNDFDSWTLDETDEFVWDIAGHQTGGSEVLMYDLEVSTINAIPEPGVALLGGLGVLGLFRRRRSRA